MTMCWQRSSRWIPKICPGESPNPSHRSLKQNHRNRLIIMKSWKVWDKLTILGMLGFIAWLIYIRWGVWTYELWQIGTMLLTLAVIFGLLSLVFYTLRYFDEREKNRELEQRIGRIKAGMEDIVPEESREEGPWEKKIVAIVFGLIMLGAFVLLIYDNWGQWSYLVEGLLVLPITFGAGFLIICILRFFGERKKRGI